MTTLVLVRHGKTLNNRHPPGAPGRRGCQLTARGREARLLGPTGRLGDGAVFAGYTRAWESNVNPRLAAKMKGIADADVDSLITKDERLRERYLAALQGRPVSK